MLDSTSFWNIYILYLKDCSMASAAALNSLSATGGKCWYSSFLIDNFKSSDDWPNSVRTDLLHLCRRLREVTLTLCACFWIAGPTRILWTMYVTAHYQQKSMHLQACYTDHEFENSYGKGIRYDLSKLYAASLSTISISLLCRKVEPRWILRAPCAIQPSSNCWRNSEVAK